MLQELIRDTLDPLCKVSFVFFQKSSFLCISETLEVAYQPHPDELKEDAETVVQGEDPEDYRDGEGKPVRQLSSFVVFDPSPSRGFELIPLDSLHDSGSTHRQFEAAGCVSPVYLNEEDAGQEDGVQDDEKQEPQRFRTSAIFRYFIDYFAIDELVHFHSFSS